MLIAGIIVVCIVLLVLAFLCRGSRTARRRASTRPLGVGQSGDRKAPGKSGGWLQKPFSTSRKATNKSASKGREGRGKMPL